MVETEKMNGSGAVHARRVKKIGDSACGREIGRRRMAQGRGVDFTGRVFSFSGQVIRKRKEMS